MHMNFGGGRQDENEGGHKSRKEVFEEIIAKSKAYKMAKSEVKEAAFELTTRLDEQFFDILPLLNMSKVKVKTEDESVTHKDDYESLAQRLKEHQRAVPAHVMMGEKEQARMRKQKLQALQENFTDEEDGEEAEKPKNRRELKDMDKRERAIERIIKADSERKKNERRVDAVEGRVKKMISKVKGDKHQEVDSDLASSSSEGEDGSDEDEEDASEERSEGEEDDSNEEDLDEGSQGDDESGEFDDDEEEESD